jgi:hypothetical protein
MAWTRASLKLVFQTDDTNDKGEFINKNKTFSNLRENATEEACKNVAKAIETLQDYSIIGLARTDYSEIEL